HADVVGFFQALARSTIWPPLHGLVLAAVLLVGGIDHRLAILPSLAGWTLTVVFAALLAHRLAGGRAHGKISPTNPAADGSAGPAWAKSYKASPLQALGDDPAGSEMYKTTPVRDPGGAPPDGEIYKTNPVAPADRAPALLAAVVAAAFTLASPAFRLLGTDVM